MSEATAYLKLLLKDARDPYSRVVYGSAQWAADAPAQPQDLHRLLFALKNEGAVIGFTPVGAGKFEIEMAEPSDEHRALRLWVSNNLDAYDEWTATYEQVLADMLDFMERGLSVHELILGAAKRGLIALVRGSVTVAQFTAKKS